MQIKEQQRAYQAKHRQEDHRIQEIFGLQCQNSYYQKKHQKNDCHSAYELDSASGAGLSYPPHKFLWDFIFLLQGLDGTVGLLTIEMAHDWACRANEGCDPVRVFCPVWRDPWMTISGDTYTHDLLRICGVQNIFDDSQGARYPVVSLQEVAARAPQVILLPSEPFPFDETHIADFAPYPELLDRVRLVDGTLLTWFGTRLGQALQQVPSWLRAQGD